MATLRKLTDVNYLPSIALRGRDGKLLIQGIDPQREEKANSLTFEIGEHTGKDFSVNFDRKNFDILPDNYSCTYNHGEYLILTSEDGKAVYYISAQAKKED